MVALALACAAWAIGGEAMAQDGGGGRGGPVDYPLPATAHQAYSPIGEGFESPIHPRENLKGPAPLVDDRRMEIRARRRGLETFNPFFRDTELTLESRTYFLGEDAFGLDRPEALTTGGYLSYQSGYLAGFLQLRAALYTTQPLYANEHAGSTLLLTEDGDQITVLGQANAKLKFAGQELTVGRQLVRTPYLNPFDVRMIPLTYEGVVLLPERRNSPSITFCLICGNTSRSTLMSSFPYRKDSASTRTMACSSPAFVTARNLSITVLSIIGSRTR